MKRLNKDNYGYVPDEDYGFIPEEFVPEDVAEYLSIFPLIRMFWS